MRRIIIPILLGYVAFFSSCAYQEYPGQPGVVTNGYSKMDYEYLDYDGLWVYEVSYDNRANGPGVGAIVTKFYPGAQVNTSNVRMNEEGTLYKHKGQYDGATVQAIVIPKLNQIMMPANNAIWFFIGATESMDEIDDRNIAEEKIFTQGRASDSLLRTGYQRARRFVQVLTAGTLKRDGKLHFQVAAIELAGKKYELKEALEVQTNVLQTSITAPIKTEVKAEFRQFFETTFANGFKGKAKIFVKGVTEPLAFALSLHTPATAKKMGFTIIPTMGQDELRRIAAQFSVN